MLGDDEELDDLVGEPIIYAQPKHQAKEGNRLGRPKGSLNTKTLIKKRMGDRATDGPKLNHSYTPDRERLIAESDELAALGDEGTSIKLAQLVHGVSVPFLSQVFRKSTYLTKERLRSLTPIRVGKNGAYFYDLFEAANALVDPKVDLGAYMKTVKISDLPQHLQENHWDTMLKRQTAEEKARDLWRTQDIREVLGDLFRLIKTRTQLFADSLDDKSPFSTAHRILLRELINDMQTEIRSDLEENMRKRGTGPIITEIEDV